MSGKGDTSGGSRPRPVYRDPNLQIVFGVTLMAVLGVTSITPAFPTIVEEFGITPQEVGWLITAFTLPGVLLTAVLGLLADQFGRKRILVPALLVFAVAGTACAFAPDFGVLVGLRFLQGIGAAGLGAMNVTIIGDLYAGRERNEAMGCNSSVLSVGTASYPAIGGALATLGWSYPFLLHLAAIPVALAVLFSLENPEPARPPDFRVYLGQVWKAMASRRVLALFVVGVLTFIIIYGPYMTFFPLWLASAFAVAPFAVGMMMSVSSVATALTASQAARLAAAFSERSLIGASCVLYGVALVAIPLMPNLWLLTIPVSILGVAQGMNMPSLMTLLAGECPMEQRGALMSVNGMVLRLGQTLGPLVMGALFVASGFGGVFLGGAVCAALMLMAVLAVMR
ncbi:MAG TPA: MFS transporter [Anaerolineae bacterium]|nr:MFS transporter [Anaerolineae bacterium]